MLSENDERTAKSRKHAQAYRTQFADPRGVSGYRRIWKSMVYQIVIEKSKGSKLWDIDGNEYVDIAMNFGLNLFGQSPDFVTQALHRLLDCELSMQFSRKNRATFCNTGSEAVMAALRLARTVTGKTKTVFFKKDYHGNFDQVLMRSQTEEAQAGSAPAAPGVPQWYADNTIVLPYGAEESLRVIEENADDIAAVLVEPCHSADPFIQPKSVLVALARNHPPATDRLGDGRSNHWIPSCPRRRSRMVRSLGYGDLWKNPRRWNARGWSRWTRFGVSIMTSLKPMCLKNIQAR